MAHPEETDLVRAARSGDRDALERLLRLHQDRIHALARRLMGDPTDALDAAQEAMIAVVRGLDGFDGRAAFGTWVYRVTTNACLDELRRRKRRPTDSLPEHETAVAGSITIHGSLNRDIADVVADRITIDAALADLPVEFRAPVVLRDLCRLDYAEIAEVLDIPPGTVRSRIARGRAQLAAALTPATPQPGNQTPPADRPSERS